MRSRISLATLGLVAAVRAMAASPDGHVTPVRVGDHPGFSRIVFDLPPDATSHLVQEGGRILLVFTGAGGVVQPAELPRNLRAIQTGTDTATLDLAPGAKVRPARIGDRLVIDVLDAAAPARPRPAGKVAVTRPAPPAVPGTATEGVAVVPTASPPPVAPVPAAAPALPPAPSAPPEAVPAPAVAVAQEPLPPAGSVPPPAPPAAKTRSFLVKADSDVGAAAFRRGDAGLIVLDRRLAQQPMPPGVTWTRGPVSTVLRVPLSANEKLRVTRSPAGWTVDQGPELAAETVAQTASEGGLDIAMLRPGRMVAVLDPVSGGSLLVGASLGTDGGLTTTRRTPDYRLLPSWLGVAVEPFSDQVDLRPGAKGFTLTGGLPAPSSGSPILSRRFDLPDEPAVALNNRLRAQLASAASAPPRARSRDRLAAVQTMIALGMGPEAQALTQQVAADDPQQADDAQTSALAAVAAVLGGRAGEAATLDDPRLDGSDEVALWRGLRDRRLGKDTPFARNLGAAAPLAMSYPATLQRLIWPEIAEAAVEAGRPVPAERLPAFAQAMALERAGKVDEAIAAFDKLGAGQDRLDQVRGTVRAAELRLAAGRAKPGDVADILERQSYAWRGDAREVGYRLRATELRTAAQQWRPALEALRAIEATYPEQKEAVQARKTVVMEAMLSAEGAGLSSVDLILLASDYADCVPDGPAGSVLARLLAEKLTALDLPTRVIPVLQGLVRATQAGPARAELGVKLGELLLDGGDPGATLAVLDASDAPNLSAALLERRALLLARSRAAAGDGAAALTALTALTTDAATDLRATLLEKTGDWRGSLAALTELVDRTVPPDGKLTETAQSLLMRQANAAVQARDSKVLARLQGMAPRLEGARADVFRLLTAAPLSTPGDLGRAGSELAAARGLPQRLQAAGLR